MQGGLPGLVMRLRQDGHEQLHVVGPCGVAAVVEAARHFVSWLHPRVVVRECTRCDPAVVYKVPPLFQNHIHYNVFPSPAPPEISITLNIVMITVASVSQQ